MHFNQQKSTRFSIADNIVIQFDQAVRSIVPNVLTAARPSPAANVALPLLNAKQARHSAGLMRVNHSGEVCAQALYNGQALTAKLPTVQHEMQCAAAEEQDHLVWCEYRLRELNSHTSLLNPLWYGMSFTLGALAGMAGDKYSLGFVAETETQVSKHLMQHMQTLPADDKNSRLIVAQMNADELAHKAQALNAGGVALPAAIKTAMTLVAKVMTTLSYYV